MNRALIFISFVLSFSLAFNIVLWGGDKKIGKDCTLKGKKLYGKVKIVESLPDIKIKAVESFPELKVKNVTSFPNKCGEWQFVESFPDFKVRFVESFPDIKIKFVTSFPGLP